jgi:hypothetical protein
MSDALLILAAAGGALAGLGGLVAAIYYAVRLREWLREQGRVSVTVLSYGAGACVYPDHVMFFVDLRLHNPKVVPCRITKVCLDERMMGYILRPLGETAQGDYRLEGDTPIELAPKQHSEVTFGYPLKTGERPGIAALGEFCLDIDLDDGSHIRSTSLQRALGLRKGRRRQRA